MRLHLALVLALAACGDAEDRFLGTYEVVSHRQGISLRGVPISCSSGGEVSPGDGYIAIVHDSYDEVRLDYCSAPDSCRLDPDVVFQPGGPGLIWETQGYGYSPQTGVCSTLASRATAELDDGRLRVDVRDWIVASDLSATDCSDGAYARAAALRETDDCYGVEAWHAVEI